MARSSGHRYHGVVRVLLVEDEPNAAPVLAKGLREQTYDVDVAADGAAAIVQIGTTDDDAVILDVMLPVKDGLGWIAEAHGGGALVLETSGPEGRTFSVSLPAVGRVDY